MLFSCAVLNAQDIAVSKGEKLSNKTTRFKILGKNYDGIIVRKYGKGVNMLDVYDNSLNLVKTRPVDFQRPDAEIKTINLNKTGATAFYTSGTKNISILYARRINSALDLIDKELVIDTILDNKEIVARNLGYRESKSKSILFFYYPKYRNGDILSMHTTVVSKDLKLLYEDDPKVSQDWRLEDGLIDNEGNTCLIYKLKDVLDDKPTTDYFLSYYDYEEGKSKAHTYNTGKHVFSKAWFNINEETGLLNIASFYTNDGPKKSRKAAHGFFVQSVDLNTGKLVDSFSYAFTKELMEDVTGKEQKNDKNELFSFRVNDVLFRRDGGFVLLAESYFKETENQGLPGSYSSSFSNFRFVSMYSYNDVMIFSVSPNDSIEWRTILRKKQLSENDNGAFSSYNLVNNGKQLRFLFLDEIFSKANLGEYIVGADGKSQRNTVFAQTEYDLMVVPKMGKQISPNEVIMPSYKRNYLKLVKLSY